MAESSHASTDGLDLDNPPFPLTAIDRQVLATKDEDFHLVTWNDLRNIVSENRLEALKRKPSDLHKYLRWSFATKAQYGSINNFVLKERLYWTLRDPSEPVSATSFTHHSSTPFSDPRDYAILVNDWPYGFVPGIKHLIVWSRTPIAVDSERGDVTPESRETIERFVENFFVKRLAAESGHGDLNQARERVLWFKNWVSLQSVRGIDHVHVLVRNAPEAILRKWLERKDL